MELTTQQLQIAGVAIIAAVAIAALWWLIRSAMGWHSGRALYWLNHPHDDDREDDDDDDDGDGTDVR